MSFGYFQILLKNLEWYTNKMILNSVCHDFWVRRISRIHKQTKEQIDNALTKTWKFIAEAQIIEQKYLLDVNVFCEI